MTFGSKTYPATIRTTSCTLLISVNEGQCKACKEYRSQLRSMYSRWLKKVKSPKKFANNRYMNTPQKQKKLKALQCRAYSAEREVKKLQEKIKENTERNGVVVGESFRDDLTKIMEESNC